ncbi:MAG: peptide chain release factor-like protein, partial [Desulfocucumaceae bacterium]
VRITHLPTGIVVQCQSERSQISNRNTAMKLLKSKLLDLEIKRKETELAAMRGDQMDIAWGSQIRSYVFHPYSLVKDHRTGVEIGNVNAIMDGEIDPFISSFLKERARRQFS